MSINQTSKNSELPADLQQSGPTNASGSAMKTNLKTSTQDLSSRIQHVTPLVSTADATQPTSDSQKVSASKNNRNDLIVHEFDDKIKAQTKPIFN